MKFLKAVFSLWRISRSILEGGGGKTGHLLPGGISGASGGPPGTHLLGVEVVAVVHVLVLAQVGGDLADFRVELDVRVPLLPKHDGVLPGEGHQKTAVRTPPKNQQETPPPTPPKKKGDSKKP